MAVRAAFNIAARVFNCIGAEAQRDTEAEVIKTEALLTILFGQEYF